MKIVIDARQLRTSSGRYVERLLENLQAIDQDNYYTILLRPKDLDGWSSANKKFHKLACPYKQFTPAEQRGLLKQVSSLKADLVHFPFVQQPAFYRGKVVTTIHDLTAIRFGSPIKNRFIFAVRQAVYKRLVRRVAHKSQAIITPSEFVKEDVARYTHTNSRKFTVTLEGADKITDPAEPMGELLNTKFVMYVGRPQPHKNLRRLIEAFIILKKTHPGLKLVLAGKKDALYKQHERYVKRNGIGGVVFTDFVTEGQLRWLYEHTAAYIFPSLSEGFGLPGLEAMAHGAPVISSNATCLPEVYGDAAHYFDPTDVRDMAAKISEVLTDEKLSIKLVKLGHNQVKKYSWRRMAEQTLEVYNQALATRD